MMERMMTVGQFVAKLEEKRGGMSINQFARSLGITGGLWSRIARGERRPGSKVVNAALAKWPDLAYWLAEDAKANAAPQMAPTGKEDAA